MNRRELRRAVARADFARIGRQAFGGDLYAVANVASRGTVERVWGVVVAFDLDGDGRSCPAQSLVAQVLGIRRETVNRVLVHLARDGVTAIHKARGHGAKWFHNRYTIPGRGNVFVHRVRLLRILDGLHGKGSKGVPHTERTATTASTKGGRGKNHKRLGRDGLPPPYEWSRPSESYEPKFEEVDWDERRAPPQGPRDFDEVVLEAVRC